MKRGTSSVKREQKTALFFREISSLVQSLSIDEPKLAKVYVTRVSLSGGYKFCYIYFSTYAEREDFDEALEVLKLYKASMRQALAKRISSRYVADLVFVYDETKEKERRILEVLDKVRREEEKVEKEPEESQEK